MATETELDAAVAEAIEWSVLFASRDVTEEDARAFHAWRDERPLNAQVYAEIASFRPKLRAAAARRAEKAGISRRTLLSGGGTMIAAVGAFGLMRPPLGLWPSLADLMADHRTGVGERYAFAPVSGVNVELNSKTSIGLLDGGSGIRLIDGETFLTIHRPSGFRVESRDAAVTSEAGQLNIEVLGDTLRIACLSGNARCDTSTGRTDVATGEQLSVRPDGSTVRAKIRESLIATWRQGMLIFNDTPLKDVVAQLNRYRSGAIVLTDKAKQDRLVNAVFFTDQIDGAVGQLQQLLSLDSRRLPGGVVLIG